LETIFLDKLNTTGKWSHW